MSLSAQHERFCREYVLDLNGSAAYRRAYPKVKSEKVARTNAARLLANASVAARVRELQLAAVARSDLTADKVLRELAFVAFQRTRQVYRDDGSYKSPAEWDEATDATIASVDSEEERVVDGDDGHSVTTATRVLRMKRWDKVQALKLLMQHFGLLKEDAPHPDRPKFDITKLTDEQKHALLALIRLSRLGS